jgi:hypothetical protein
MLSLQSLGYVAEGEGFVLRRSLGTLRSFDLSNKKRSVNFWRPKTTNLKLISKLPTISVLE